MFKTAIDSIFGFLDKPISVNNVWNSAFATISVAVALIISQQGYFTASAGILVLCIQSVTAVNAPGPFRERFIRSLRAGIVLGGTTVFAIITKEFLITHILAVVILAFSFGFWRKMFPINWADINIPAGIVFYMAYAARSKYEPMQAAFTGILLGLLAQLIIGILAKNSANPGTDMSNYKSEPSYVKPSFSFDKELLVYCVQLAFLLSIATLSYNYFDFEHGFWLSYTLMIVLQTTYQKTKEIIVQRILGTTAGCILGSIIIFLHPPFWVHLFITTGCIFAFLILVKDHYTIACIFITIFVLLLVGGNSEHPIEIIMERLFFTFAGGIFAFLSSFLFIRNKMN